MTYEQLAKLAEEAGFTAWGPLDVATIDLKPEVRDMCAVNSCGLTYYYGPDKIAYTGCFLLKD